MSVFVQFIHPGKEHTEKTGKIWNKGEHRRKFLEVNGEYLDSLEGSVKQDTLYFWGEWEAKSDVTKISGNKKDLPHFVFKPFYSIPIGNVNTDPFVFGTQFYYCICKQGSYTSLRNLNKGDVILFGSCLRGNFVLDTVFVVKDWDEYKVSKIPELRDKYNQPFYDVSLIPITKRPIVPEKMIIEKDSFCLPICLDDDTDSCPTHAVATYRIYKAVMYNERHNFNGIFSYSPCISKENKGEFGFERPIIKIPSIISDNLKQGIKNTSVADSKMTWNLVTKIVLKANLSIMISNTLPSSKEK